MKRAGKEKQKKKIKEKFMLIFDNYHCSTSVERGCGRGRGGASNPPEKADPPNLMVM